MCLIKNIAMIGTLKYVQDFGHSSLDPFSLMRGWGLGLTRLDHMGSLRKGTDKPRGCISQFYSKLPLTMVDGAFHKVTVRMNFSIF